MIRKQQKWPVYRTENAVDPSMSALKHRVEEILYKSSMQSANHAIHKIFAEAGL